MFRMSERGFARLPRGFRYIYFLASGVRLKGYGEWKRDGEPNPFVKAERRRRSTTRIEIVDIFAENLGDHRK